MDNTCAVCAETLEWVAYGECGHREVCSTCVARLRFICHDPRCCICKTESRVVFVTKDLGDFTRMIIDFSVFPSEPKEGRTGPYWYHEGTQAFFDDVDHYRMVKAMCKLSCSVCDNMEEKSNDASRRRGKFRNIEQLKGHMYHNHRLVMCSLCLEGRKVFICEQKLYSRSQLNQHIETGDSEVDGSESERGGFMGHPICEFCKTPFYGDNELYTHMSTEHYTCFICQRQHPGQYEYFKNYDDLEIHFRQEHFLCEDEDCLAKKFVVFKSEAEMKRHNTLEHGGRMSRSKRNAALQIPTSFHYRRGNEQDRRRGRARTFHRDFAEAQISVAIQASLDTANADSIRTVSSSVPGPQVTTDHGDLTNVDEVTYPLESLSMTDNETSSRYLQALGNNPRNATLPESAFPPLPIASSSNQELPKHDSEGPSSKTMAAQLRRKKGGVSTGSTAQTWPAASHSPAPAPSSTVQAWPAVSRSLAAAPSAVRPINVAETASSTSSGPASLSYAILAKAPAQERSMIGEAGTSASPAISSKMKHSASLPNFAERRSVEPPSNEFPPVSANQVRKLPSTDQPLPKVENVHAANKSLVERIRAALDDDEEKYASFKEISGHYRQGAIDTEMYLDYVERFGLSHLILDLARLLPDTEKQRELLDAYNFNVRKKSIGKNGLSEDDLLTYDNGSRKGKGKSIDTGGSHASAKLTDNFLSTVRELQSNRNPPEQEVEVLSRDGYRSGKGKSIKGGNGDQLAPVAPGGIMPTEAHVGPDSSRNGGGNGGIAKQRKKTSKFHSMRLGEGSSSAPLDLRTSDQEHKPDLGPVDQTPNGDANTASSLPLRGVWRKGGGSKLNF
ncbi:hypothetical protein MLD38_025767 [Melastoma candidum]|uniref:Uncharacterized protein n=1 Tax=Melastoma candidum TaxID=119954 RepID=A0ACB9NZJ6_9MYRT|nr:hypothetical protein MLD38_025767 [Melastoma candidum]